MSGDGGFDLKVERAKFHFETLKPEVEAFDNPQDHCTWKRELKSEGRHHIYRVETVKEAPLFWSPVIGDFLSNMRSALDVLAYQLCLSVKPDLTSDERKAIAFPIALTYERFLELVPRLSPMGMKAIAAIEALQPYHRRNADTHPLIILHRLDNINKHRNIHITRTALQFAAQFLPPDPQPEQWWIKGARLIPGAEIGRYVFPEPRPEVNMNPAFGFRVVIDASVAPSNQGINELFAGICTYVDTRVIPSLIPLLVP